MASEETIKLFHLMPTPATSFLPPTPVTITHYSRINNNRNKLSESNRKRDCAKTILYTFYINNGGDSLNRSELNEFLMDPPREQTSTNVEKYRKS